MVLRVPTILGDVLPDEEKERKPLLVPSEEAAETVGRLNRLMAQQRDLVAERAVQPQLLTADDINTRFQDTIPADWTMTLLPSVEGEVPGYVLNALDGWKVTDADIFISPTGEEFTEEEVRALPLDQVPRSMFEITEVPPSPEELEKRQQYIAITEALATAMPETDIEELIAMEEGSLAREEVSAK